MTLRLFSSEKKFFGDTVRINSQGDSNLTSGAAAALLQNDTAIISVAKRHRRRVYHFVVAALSAKEADSAE